MTILNGVTYSGASNGIAAAPLAVANIGGISVPEYGLEFKSSLVLQAKVTTGNAYVGWAYRLFA